MVSQTAAGDSLWLRWGSITVLLVALTPRAGAQVISTREQVQMMPPWNAQRVFDPTALPQLSYPDTREPVAPEDIPVRRRIRPEYQARGLRSGSWMFNSALTAGGLYDSNVFSSSNNRQSDLAARIGTDLRTRSLWERHGVDMQLTSESLFYRNYPGLNATDVNFKGKGHFDVSHDYALLASMQAAYLHDEVGALTSPRGAVEPTPYGFLSGDLTLRRESGRVTTSAGARVDSYDYGSTRAQDGSIINQDARDGQVYRAHGRFDYAFSEKTAWFTAVEGNRRDLQGTPAQQLGSSGYRALTGFDFSLTKLITVELGGGYMAQQFDAASIGTFEGPTYRAIINWSPSRKLDIHFNAEQLVTESSDTSSTGIRASAFRLGFDYELRPNVIWSNAATYERDQFKGQVRTDDVYAVDTRIRYLLNPFSSVSVFHRYLLRDSDSPGASFDKHQVGINASARF